MKHWNTKYPERFNLDVGEEYKKWRDEKLAAYPRNVGELVVDLGDMTAITEGEKGKIRELVELANMCVYTAGSADLSMDSLLALTYLPNVVWPHSRLYCCNMCVYLELRVLFKTLKEIDQKFLSVTI